MSAAASRRGLLAGLASFAGIGAPRAIAAAPAFSALLPAVAPIASPPADLALIEASATWTAALVALDNAEAAFREAHEG